MEISESQLDELKAGKEKLMNSAQQLFAKMYEQAQGAQGGADYSQANYGQSAGPNDDVVDADFKEV